MTDNSIYKNFLAGEILQGIMAFSEKGGFDGKIFYKLIEKIGLGEEYSEKNLQQIINNLVVWDCLQQDTDPTISPHQYKFNKKLKNNAKRNIPENKRKILESLAKEFDAMHEQKEN